MSDAAYQSLTGLLGGGLYLIASISFLVFMAVLIWAPMKLYAIHRELSALRDLSATQTKLLAAIANRVCSEDVKTASAER